ncbi:TonB-dependent receptor [Novosphingobium sp. P6W]|uniref:TonB-dependent receptor n=1 Tax=Novosphingobium sp. P6W TaxID=1609758 RepID=UPI0005C2CB4E|nr:TonB-dependent receptor [Novosphingobium sp. P6W]AXB78713.1 TonB-dependent receptor [Novosphingobium sp. P6W]KIS31733.1 TonB-dependent receptor [Novosphingobium sp. P6W]
MFKEERLHSAAKSALFLSAVSVLALANAAYAQEAPAAAAPQASFEDGATPEDIIVTGMRASQKAAIDIKRDSIAVVDSIVAEDLGKLPDQNVAESLQRIAGVTIERNRGEGRYITVRGFGPKFNAVTVNGRTLATDNNGREFSFDVLPSEIIGGADVYKSPQANINGASIGATVDVKTLRAIDQKEQFAFSASGGQMWAELADKFNPEASGVASWRNADKTIGISLAGVYTKRDTRNDEFTIGAGHVYRSSTDSYYNAGGVPRARIGPDVAPFSRVSMPSNLSPFFFERSLERYGFSGSLQFRPTDTLSLSFDGLYSKADFTEQQTGLAYDFSGGTLVEQVVEGGEAVYQRYQGGFVDQILQYDRRKVTTSQFGANAEWKPTDTLRFSVDVSRSKAERRGKEDNLFTTIRRKNTDLWFDRRSGNPIYDYGFTNPNYPNAATSPQGITAHYYIWGGGTDVDDKIGEYRFDTDWQATSNLKLFAGGMIANRKKILTGDEMPFGEQCAYCGSDRVLPSALFRPTNRNFFQGAGGSNILHDWVIYDPARLVGVIDQFAAEDGKAFNPAVFSPSASSVIDEKVRIGYVMANFQTDLGSMPLTINAGLRYENTDYTSSGASRTVLSAKPNGQGQNLIVVSPIVPVSFRGKYHDWLPSLNIKLEVARDVILRVAASKVMTRPTLTDLSPRQSIQTNPGNETISRGNPDLKPFRAKQVEAGAEWYFSDSSLLSFAAFYKKIDSFVTLVTTPQLVDEVTFQVTVPGNGKGATVKGFEVGYRQAFTGLPSPLDGLGVQTSFNYTKSDAKYENTVANVSYGLEGLSKTSYSLVGYYEKYGVQARLAYTWRDNFLQVASGRNGEPEYFAAYGQLDAGLSYEVTPQFTVFADAINLNDAKEFIYSVTENRTKEYRKTGRRFSGGVRVRF